MRQNDDNHGFLVLSSGDSARRWKYSEKPGSCRLMIINVMMRIIINMMGMINDEHDGDDHDTDDGDDG